MAELEVLRDYRKRHGLTQADLARILGVKANYIARWECGSRPLPPRVALALHQRTGISLTKLLPDIYPPSILRSQRVSP